MNLLPRTGELFKIKLEIDTSHLMEQIIENAHWRQDKFKIYGKEVSQPRQVAWYGDQGITYKYSNITMIAKGWPDYFVEIKKIVENFSHSKFNSVLVNHYRNGMDYMGWHSDDEKELGRNPIIASLSLGAIRQMQFRLKSNHSQKVEVDLADGDLLIMRGETQHFWQHALPKRKRIVTNRINLTFRHIFVD